MVHCPILGLQGSNAAESRPVSALGALLTTTAAPVSKRHQSALTDTNKTNRKCTCQTFRIERTKCVTSATSEWGETIRRGVSEKGEGEPQDSVC